MIIKIIDLRFIQYKCNKEKIKIKVKDKAHMSRNNNNKNYIFK